MRAAVLRQYCLSFPGSLETFAFGPETSVFKVADKMFALSQLARRPLRISLKCEPELAEQLREAHPAVLPGYHLNKRHWNTVIIDGSLPEQMLKDMIEDSYDLVVSQLRESRRRALATSSTRARRSSHPRVPATPQRSPSTRILSRRTCATPSQSTSKYPRRGPARVRGLLRRTTLKGSAGDRAAEFSQVRRLRWLAGVFFVLGLVAPFLFSTRDEYADTSARGVGGHSRSP
jgi:predicted DNA-binding protein (MmcQ/YjbR family)